MWPRTARVSGTDTEEVIDDILRPILRRLWMHPFRIAVVDDWRRWRGVELVTAAATIAGEIDRRTDGERIGVMLPTSGMFPAALLGAWLLPRTVVPINYLLKPPERDHILEEAEIDLVVTVSPMLEQFGALPPDVKTILLDRMRFPRLPRFRRPPKANPERTAVLIYTSGTSGTPKGVELTERNLAANAWQCARWGNVTSRDVFLGVLPQFHSFGLAVLTLLPLSTGAKVVYTARFVPRKILALMRAHRPTGFVGIPAMYNGLLADKSGGPGDFTSFRLLICGGEPLAPRVRERVEERFGITINEGYGLTETSSTLNWARPGELAAGSVGKPLPRVEEVVKDKAGNVLAAGDEGEICVRGPNLMKRYFKRPETTAAVFDGEGYFHTGDLGRIDEEGRLFITGRISDLIIVAGENVFPREIEDVLTRHPSVTAAAVVGISDTARGEVPVAFVELAPDSVFDERRLRAYCREQLAGYKVPRRIIAVDELPRAATGKVSKSLLPLELLESGRPAEFAATSAVGP